MNPRSGLALAAAVAAMTIGACMHAPGSRAPAAAAPTADSTTILLWHMDEAGGDRVIDSGGYRLDGVAGLDSKVDFGRFGNARVFTNSVESFAYLAYNPSLESPAALTVEAWIYVNAIGDWEDTPIAGRWTELPGDQSWLFSVVGSRLDAPTAEARSPGFHRSLVLLGGYGRLMFAMQPEDATQPVAFFSTFPLEKTRWVHVAVTFDGEVVRFYVDGRLDSQFAHAGRIRVSRAPLLVGNYFDPRWITDFGGSVRVGNTVDRNAYYAFQGLIDEFRMSSVARSEFPTTGR